MNILNKISKFFDFKNTIFLCLWFVGTGILLNLLAFGYLEYLGSTVGISRKEVLPNIPWFGKVLMLFFLAFLIPLWEEFVFRFWLGKKFSILTVISLGLFLSLIQLPRVDFPLVAILYIIVVLSLLIFRKKIILQKELDFTTSNNLPYAIGLSSVIFAFGHFYYYQDTILDNPQYLNLSLFLVFITFGYLGLILSFVRLKFGFKKSLIVHIFANFLATAPMFF